MIAVERETPQNAATTSKITTMEMATSKIFEPNMRQDVKDNDINFCKELHREDVTDRVDNC